MSVPLMVACPSQKGGTLERSCPRWWCSSASASGVAAVIDVLRGAIDDRRHDEPARARRAVTSCRSPARDEAAGTPDAASIHRVLTSDQAGSGRRREGKTRGALDVIKSASNALAENCRFSDCRHEAEPGCGVQSALGASNRKLPHQPTLPGRHRRRHRQFRRVGLQPLADERQRHGQRSAGNDDIAGTCGDDTYFGNDVKQVPSRKRLNIGRGADHRRRPVCDPL